MSLVDHFGEKKGKSKHFISAVLVVSLHIGIFRVLYLACGLPILTLFDSLIAHM